jgi:hypothetical protein
MITSVALLDTEVVARQPEWRGILERQVWLLGRQLLTRNITVHRGRRGEPDLTASPTLPLPPAVPAWERSANSLLNYCTLRILAACEIPGRLMSGV